MKPAARLKALKAAKAEADERRQWAFDHQHEIYQERDLLVAVLARVWPSHVMEHTHSPRSAGRRLVICIHAPFGRLTWTIPPSYEPIYQRMAQCGENDYDGCKTAEKRARLLSYCESTPCEFPGDAAPITRTLSTHS